MIPVRSYLRLLYDYLRRQKLRVAVLALTLFTGIGLALIGPQLVRSFLDRALDGTESSELIPIAVWFMAIAVFQQLFSVVATYLAEQVGWTATNEMRADLAAHVLDLDMGFHKQHTPGEMIERIDGDVTAQADFFSAFAIRVLGNSLLMVGVMVLLWRENVWVGFGITVFFIAALAAMLKIQAWAVPLWKQVRARSAELMGLIGEQLGGGLFIRRDGGHFVAQPQQAAAHLPYAIGAYGKGTVDFGSNDESPVTRCGEVVKLRVCLAVIFHNDVFAISDRSAPVLSGQSCI